MIYLLDTNHCSRLLENDHAVLAATIALSSNDILATTITVRGELFFMVEASDRRHSNRIRLDALLERLVLLDLDAPTDATYGALKAKLFAHYAPRERRVQRTLHTIGISENDAWIAAAALRHSATVVSADGDFSRIRAVAPELLLVSWWTPPKEPAS